MSVVPIRGKVSLDEAARIIAAIKGGTPRKQGNGYLCRCPMPGHEDRRPSFSVDQGGNGEILVHCHAGCDQRAVFSLLQEHGIFGKRGVAPGEPVWPAGSAGEQVSRQAGGREPGNGRKDGGKKTYHAGAVQCFSASPVRPAFLPPRIQGMQYAGHWIYHDADGRAIGVAARYQNDHEKRFSYFFTPGKGDGEFLANIPEPYKSAPRHLYRLPDLIQAGAAESIWITEGEACAEAIRSLGAIATTSMGGAQSAAKSDWSPLRGHKVVLWPDADNAGDQYGREVVRQLWAAGAASIGIVDTRALGMDNGEDVIDWLDRTPGAELDELGDLINLNPGAAYESPRNPAAPKAAEARTRTPNGGGGGDGQTGQEEYEPVSHVQAIVQYPNERKDGSLEPTFMSAVYQAQSMDLRFDLLCNQILLDGRNLETAHVRELTLLMNQKLDTKFTIQTVEDAIVTVAQRRAFHPIRKKLLSLQWDGVRRLNTLIARTFHVQDSPYHQRAGENFLTMAAKRILEPGCKADNMLLLYGKQGPGKSSFVRELAFGNDGWYTELWDNPSSKDFYQNLRAHWIIELSELDSFRNAAETSIKRFLSARHDTYRPPYGRESRTFPRQCVFVGTTNDPRPLREYNGNRRFWPVLADRIDMAHFLENRDQYWAEAVHLARSGFAFWEMPQETGAVQEQYREHHPWEGLIETWMAGDMDDICYPADVGGKPPARVRTDLLLELVILKPRGMWARNDEMLVGQILRHMGWTPKRVQEGSVRRYYYYPGEDVDEKT